LSGKEVAIVVPTVSISASCRRFRISGRLSKYFDLF
jgi:hypothetical protein